MGHMAAVLAGVCCLMAGGGVAAQEGAGARDRAGSELCLAAGKQPARLADLCVGAVAVSPARFLTFTVRNRGSGSINAGFPAEVYINGVMQETIEFSRLSRSSGRKAETRVAKFADCEKGTIRLVLDPKNVVSESDELNNDYSIDRAPPCPDVTASIDQARVNNKQYRIQVSVVNEGTARMSAVDVGIIAAIRDPARGGPTLEQCETASDPISVSGCLFQTLRTSALAPGQSRRFTIGGNIPATRTAEVKVTLKCVLGADCLESKDSNNVVSRILAPR
ncbi:MAG TPA: CARDB domain-containing protein [Gemmatimonadales bacterium]|nr:CARDB domain-containing protein [Gemmatimonadales bacterium]